MTTPYFGIELNDPTTPKPWGSREFGNFKEIIDAIRLDTVSETLSDAKTIGHHHYKLYSETTNDLAVHIDSSKRATFESDVFFKLGANFQIAIPEGEGFVKNDAAGNLSFGNPIVDETTEVKVNNGVITGWMEAPTLSVNADPTKFDISSGKAFFIIKDTQPFQFIEYDYAGATGINASLGLGGRVIYIFMDKLGAISQQNSVSGSDLYQKAFIGNLTKNQAGDQIDFATIQAPTTHSIIETARLFLSLIGGIQVVNMVHSGVAATLQANRSAGTVIRLGVESTTDNVQPDTQDVPSANPITTIQQRYVNENNVIVFYATSTAPAVFDPAMYYNKDTQAVTAVGTNNYSIQRQYFFSGSNTEMSLLGNTIFGNLADAKAAFLTPAEEFTKPIDLRGAVLLGAWIFKGNATDTTNASTSEFVPYLSPFELAGSVAGGGGGGGASDFLSLTDVPSSYSNFKEAIPAVNDTEDGLEFRYIDQVVFEDDFESGSFATKGWNVVNDSTNQWIVSNSDPIPVSSDGHSAYISNNGATRAYTNNAANVSHIYIDVPIPDDIARLVMFFDWLCEGETGAGNDEYDFFRVFWTTTANTPTAGVLPTAGYNQIGLIKYQGTQYTQNEKIVLSENDTALVAGTTTRFVLTWRNDAAAGNNPPIGIDNFSIVAQKGIAGVKPNLICDLLARRTTNQSLTNGVATDIQFNKVMRDSFANYDTLNHFITIKEAGFYNINVTLDISLSVSNPPSGYILVQLMFNNDISDIVGNTSYPNVASGVPFQVNFSQYLIKGTQVKVRCINFTGFTATVLGQHISKLRMIGRRG